MGHNNNGNPDRLINNKRPYRIEDMWIRSGNTSQNQYYTFEHFFLNVVHSVL